MLVLVDDHLGDLGRSECAADQFGLIVGPRHDVDFLAAQLLHHRLHARALHPDAGADRIDVGILGINRDLCAAAGLARTLADFDDALVDFGHLLLEQLAQELVGSAREHDREALFGQIDVEDQRADAIALAIALMRNLLLLGQYGFGAAEIDDHVFALEALHDARDNFALAILELVEDLFALGVADVLDEVLLGRLRRDPAHGGGVELDQDFVADLGLGIVLGARLVDCGFGLRIGHLVDHGPDLEQLDLAELGVVARLDIALAEGAPRRRMHHLLDRADHDRLVDPFFLGNLLNHPVKLSGHRASTGRDGSHAPPNPLPANPEPVPSRPRARRAAASSAAGSIKIVFVVRSLHFAKADAYPAPARFVFDFHSLGTHRREHARERFLPIHRAMRLYPD